MARNSNKKSSTRAPKHVVDTPPSDTPPSHEYNETDTLIGDTAKYMKTVEAKEFYNKLVDHLISLNLVSDHVSETKFETKKTSTRKKSEATARKKTKTGYILFSADARKDIREEEPQMSPREVMAEIGRRWKALPEEEKDEYRKRAAEESEE